MSSCQDEPGLPPPEPQPARGFPESAIPGPPHHGEAPETPTPLTDLELPLGQPESADQAEPVDPVALVDPETSVEPADGSEARPSPRRRRRIGRLVGALAALVVVGAAVAVLAAAVRFGLDNRRDAADSRRAASGWQRQAEAEAVAVAEQLDRVSGLDAQVAALQAEIAALRRGAEADKARGDGLQALLDDTNRRLSEAEIRVAALAGEAAQAADRAILGR